MPATLRLCVRVCEQLDAGARGARRMHVLTPASGGSVLVSATNPNPHRAAVFLHLTAHNGGIGPVELVERLDDPRLTTAGMGPLWTFVVTLELPDA